MPELTVAPEDEGARLDSYLASYVQGISRSAFQRLIEDGCTRFVEVGPGKVLTGLLKRIAPDCKVANVSTVEALKAGLDV